MSPSSDIVKAVLVELRGAPPAELFDRASSKRERLELIERFWSSRKAALIHRLLAVPNITVDDLSSGATLIVRGPGELIDSLIAPGGLLDTEDVEIAPVECYYTG